MVKLCQNGSGREAKKGLTKFLFPTEVVTVAEWIRVLELPPDFRPTKMHRVCEDHFTRVCHSKPIFIFISSM